MKSAHNGSNYGYRSTTSTRRIRRGAIDNKGQQNTPAYFLQKGQMPICK